MLLTSLLRQPRVGLFAARFETAPQDLHHSDAHAIAAALHIPARGGGTAFGKTCFAATCLINMNCCTAIRQCTPLLMLHVCLIHRCCLHFAALSELDQFDRMINWMLITYFSCLGLGWGLLLFDFIWNKERKTHSQVTCNAELTHMSLGKLTPFCHDALAYRSRG